MYLDIYASSANHKITGRVCTFTFFSGILYHSEYAYPPGKEEINNGKSNSLQKSSPVIKA